MPKMKKVAIVLIIVVIGSLGIFKAGMLVGAAGIFKVFKLLRV